jgi:hypothetical protein
MARHSRQPSLVARRDFARSRRRIAGAVQSVPAIDGRTDARAGRFRRGTGILHVKINIESTNPTEGRRQFCDKYAQCSILQDNGAA